MERHCRAADEQPAFTIANPEGIVQSSPGSARRGAGNLASGRMLAKLGTQREGLLRQLARKNKVFEDVVVLGLLRGECDKLSQD